MPQNPLALIILDGWGISSLEEGNAVMQAHTPYFDLLRANYPSTELASCGEAIGQEKNEVGNAEAGHLCIGTGRPTQGEVSRVERAIRSREFENNEVLLSAMQKAADANSTLHLIGLLSDGGVHSTTDSLFELLRMAKAAGITDIAVHAILDGVDVPQRTADVYLEALEIKMADIGVGRIASLCGRYFAMDSRGNWERTARAYTMLVHAEGERSTDAVTSVRNSFLRGIADEFIAPIVIGSDTDPGTEVKDGDLVIYFNHRPETMQQLVRSLSIPDSLGTRKPIIDSVCLTEYDRSFDLPVAFPAEDHPSGLSDILGEAGIVNLKITQSERFPHLTYFFNGGMESQSATEQTLLIPTPKGATVELTPESQSFKIADKMIRCLENDGRSVYVVNLPAAALAAETGRFDRTLEAIQYVDTCLGGIVDKVIEAGGTAVITSSYGRCEHMATGDEVPRENQNTTNPVPFILAGAAAGGVHLRTDGSLADIAPTILSILDLEPAAGMQGRDLRAK